MEWLKKKIIKKKKRAQVSRYLSEDEHVYSRSLDKEGNASRCCCQCFTWSKLGNILALAIRSGSCPRCATCTRPWPSLRLSFSSTRGGKSTGSPRSCLARTSLFLLWYLFLSFLFFFWSVWCFRGLLSTYSTFHRHFFFFFLTSPVLAWWHGAKDKRRGHERVPLWFQSNPHNHWPAGTYNIHFETASHIVGYVPFLCLASVFPRFPLLLSAVLAQDWKFLGRKTDLPSTVTWLKVLESQLICRWHLIFQSFQIQNAKNLFFFFLLCWSPFL